MISSMISFTVLILFVYTTSAVKISNGSLLHGIQFPNHPSFNSATSSVDSGCQTTITASALDLSAKEEKEEGGVRPAKPPLKVHLKHRATNLKSETDRKETVKVFTHRDLLRIHTLHRRITEGKNQNTVSRLATSTSKTKFKSRDQRRAKEERPTTQLVATLESGVSLGSGEYFMDVYIGTPPKHFSLILDTGSDLNWIQCVPCHDCFEQQGNPYDPKDSSSFRNISCVDPQCKMVSSPDPPRPCKSANQTCQYFYWYGDQSNTTGDFAMETFTVNLTSHNNHELELRHVENVLFGCGHWNRGLFHGAAGLLGLGRGPLSFSSQLRSLYGDTFSYCLVDRNSNISISSKLIFGEDERLMSHPNLNFTSLVSGKENPVDTFYYVQIKGIMVGKELLNIPSETWQISSEGAGGMIIDSGTTLSYFAEPAYKIIKEAFEKKVKYPKTEDFPVLDPCYNVTGIEKVLLPEFSILFADGAVWDFPVENYFIRLDPEELICLAILGTPRSSLSILGNYQQQNFHIQYDTNKSRLGFAPMKCADV